MSSRSFRRSTVALFSVIGMAAAALVAVPQVSAAPRVHPLTAIPTSVEIVGGLLTVRVSAGSGSIVAGNIRGESEHVDVSTGASTRVQDGNAEFTPIPGGSDFTFGTNNRGVLKRALGSGELEIFSEFDFPPDNEGETISSWGGVDEVVADDNGRFIAFRASNPTRAEVRAFLFDTEAGEIPEVLADGLITDTRQSAVERIGADGSYVLTRAFDSAGSVGSAVVRWNTETGTLRTVDRPVEMNASTGGWDVSDDVHWTVFPSDTIGSDSTTRLYRRDNRTGDVIAVPVDYSTVRFFAVRDGGRVVMLSDVDGPDSGQLFSWDGHAASLTALSVKEDGTYGSGPVESFFVNADASLVTFVSFADDLADGTRAGERNVYQVALPTLRRVGKIAASDTFCLAVRGADAGDWVSVNVTPVEAERAGFGTIHSSDDPAGATASVNFDLGSVDPNIAFAQVGTDGRVCFTNSEHGPVHVVVDQMTVSPSDSFVKPMDGGAIRLVDTRKDDVVGALAENETRCVAAQGDVVPGSWVSVNITPVEAEQPGFGTLHSSDNGPGATASVNFFRNSVDPNIGFVQVGADGEICFTNSEHGPVHVVLDQMTVSAEDAFSKPSNDGAVRLMDTRIGVGGDRVDALETRCVAVVAAAADEWVAVNVTPVEAERGGFGTVHSSDDDAGPTASVNFGLGTVDPNTSLVQVGADGEICFTNSEHGPVEVVIDQMTVSTSDSFSKPTAQGSVRLIDTREAQ